MADDRTTQRITDELKSLVSIIEEITGMPSRWNGEISIVDTTTAVFLARQPFMAAKEWTCSITVVDAIAETDLRWRTFIHELLHSVSVGLREQDYSMYRGWEEGVVESLQRQYRPEILRRLNVTVPEAVFVQVEKSWSLQHYIDALKLIVAQMPGVSEQEFFEALLHTPLKDRVPYVMTWGKRQASNTMQFLRVYAEACGKLRS